MCGIAGAYYFNGAKNLFFEKREHISKLISHRGPDDEGYYGNSYISLLHRRLSILDLSPLGHQPMKGPKEGTWLIFNGEIYNYIELREALIKKGHTFKSSSDTEVILHLYAEYGKEKFVNYLSGMFAFALWDETTGELILCRDRTGKKPLFYTQTNDSIIFSSEIKPILYATGKEVKINYNALNQYLSFRYCLDPNTFFSGIESLEAGYMMIVNQSGNIQRRKYWDYLTNDESSYKTSSQASIEAQCNAVVENAVSVRLRSDVPVGSYLSGGLDSSIVTALMAKHSGYKVKTFSIGYDSSEFNELSFAKRVADHLGTDHHEVELKHTELPFLVDKLVYHLESPIADSALISIFKMSEYANKHCKVLMSGVGGDEAFCGYPKYKSAMISYYLDKLLNNPILRNIPGNPLKKLKIPFENFVPWRHFNSDDKKILFNNELLRGEEAGSINTLLDRVADKPPLQKIMYLMNKTWLIGDLLHGADKMSMAASIEQRVPFVDVNVLEFGMGLKTSTLLSSEKDILKRTFKNMLPPEILNRKKLGFQVPETAWVEKYLKEMILDHFHSAKFYTRNFYNQQNVLRLVEDYEKNRNYDAKKIWMLFLLEKWCNIFLDEKKWENYESFTAYRG